MLDRSEKGRMRNLAAVSENGWDVCLVSCFLPIVVPMYRYTYSGINIAFCTKRREERSGVGMTCSRLHVFGIPVV